MNPIGLAVGYANTEVTVMKKAQRKYILKLINYECD